MKKSAEVLSILIVILALVGFIVITSIAIYKTITTTGDVLINERFLYLANGLTGLVGGIVSLGFGISPPSSNTNGNLLDRSMIGLGGLVTDGNLFTAINVSKNTGSINKNNNLNAKTFFGYTYALVYIVICTAAIVVWIIDAKPHEIVKNLATIFIGMIIPIVAGYFKENS
jgi:hypothetical protein